MKKRLLTVLAVAMLLVGLAGQAMAYFEEGHLYRVVYTQDDYGYAGTYEVVTDLGSGYTSTSLTTTTASLTSNSFSLSQLGVSDWSNVYVAYYIYTTKGTTGTNGLWVSGSDESGQKVAKSNYNSISGLFNDVRVANVSTGNAQNVSEQSADGSYSSVMGTEGRLAGLISSSSSTFADASLAALSTVGYVDQYIYYYASSKLSGSGTAAGTLVYQIRTYADGTTVINPVATPVPAAIYLLGTGLLALIGIRRKTAVDENQAA